MAGPTTSAAPVVPGGGGSSTSTVIVPWTQFTTSNMGLTLGSPTQDSGIISSASETGGVFTFVSDNAASAMTGITHASTTYWILPSNSDMVTWSSTYGQVLHLLTVVDAPADKDPSLYRPAIGIAVYPTTGGLKRGSIVVLDNIFTAEVSVGGAYDYGTSYAGTSLGMHLVAGCISFSPGVDYSTGNTAGQLTGVIHGYKADGTLRYSADAVNTGQTSSYPMTGFLLYFGHRYGGARGTPITTKWRLYYAITTTFAPPEPLPSL